MRLHRTYGPGLKDLADPKSGGLFGTRGQTTDGDPATTGINPDGTRTINGIIMNVTDWKAAPLGLVSGLQYNNNTFGKCFYATVDTVSFADYFQQDVEAFFSEGDFYQILVYDPVRFTSNALAVYE